jgi:hypothetical protein
MRRVDFNGWANCVLLEGDRIEAVVTADVGPRIIRFGFKGERNLFAEITGQQGGSGEGEWMIRGGHRLWLSPERQPLTYELDNSPIEVEEIPGGVRALQPAGELSGVAKTLDVTLSADSDRAELNHVLTNRGAEPLELAPWALTVLAPGGISVIPLPPKIPHTERLTHNQQWSIWGYTDFTDPRWTLGSRYVLFRQDPERGPAKLGIANREGWAAYLLDGFLFVKFYRHDDAATYPDGGVSYETFAEQDFLEMETLGGLVSLGPGESVSHRETWALFRDVAACDTEAEVDEHVLPLVTSAAAEIGPPG